MPPRSNLSIPQGTIRGGDESPRGPRDCRTLCRLVLDSPPPCPPLNLERPKVPQRAGADGAIGDAREQLGPGGRCPAREGARRGRAARGTKARGSGDPRRLESGLTPRRHTLSSRIAIMCFGPSRTGAQQHRPGRTAPSLRPAVSQSSRPPRGGTVAGAISGPRPPRSVTCRRPAPPDASSLA